MLFEHKKVKIGLKILGLAILLAGILAAGYTLGESKIAKYTPSNNTFSLPPRAIDADIILEIPKIEVQVPVILDVDGKNKSEYYKALEGGVAQMKNTSHPGEPGNVVIFGHSSYLSWAGGDYKEIFKRFDELEPGDKVSILLKNDDKTLYYQVVERKIIDANRIDVIKQTDDDRLTLLTCWPPGTTEKRMMVIAKPTS